MNVFTWTKNKILSFLGLFKLTGTPNNERLTYINDEEAIILSNIRANRVWYSANGDELLNWYTNQQTYGLHIPFRLQHFEEYDLSNPQAGTRKCVVKNKSKLGKAVCSSLAGFECSGC